MTCISIRNYLINCLIVLVLGLFLTACVSEQANNQKNFVSGIDIDEINGNQPTREFARLCLAENKSIAQLVEFARTEGWEDASDRILEKYKLGNLRRTILEIPGGGGHYRETQSILRLKLKSKSLIANFMERYNRQDILVRTDCTIYINNKNHLPVCSAVGTLLNRPPDSNNTFQRSNSHFIRWEVFINEKQANVRCDGAGIANTETKRSKENDKSVKSKEFTGTVISMIVDHTALHPPPKSARANILKQNSQR